MELKLEDGRGGGGGEAHGVSKGFLQQQRLGALGMGPRLGLLRLELSG